MTQQARPSVITKLRQLHDLHAGRACLASHPGVSPTMSAQVMALPADNAMALTSQPQDCRPVDYRPAETDGAAGRPALLLSSCFQPGGSDLNSIDLAVCFGVGQC